MLSQLPDYLEWKASRDRTRWRRRLFRNVGIVAVFLAAFAVAWNYLPQSMDLSHIYKQWAQERELRKSWVYYPNCAIVRYLGKAPIRRGEPGYRPALDADNDGIACESVPSWAR